MAKKSLKKRIDDLVDALGGAEKPTLVDIRNELVAMGALAESLENEQALAEKDARIAELEAQLGSVQVALQTASAEIEAFRAERKKQQESEREREIAPIQLKILRKLPSEYGGSGLSMYEIARAASVPVDEAEVYMNGLEAAGLAVRWYNEPDGTMWRRTSKGNELVVAKRWAGEEEPKDTKPQRSKHGALTSTEETVLLLLARNEGEGVTVDEVAKVLNGTEPMALFILVTLRQKDMASDGDDPDWGTPRRWFILRNGLEHLAERGLI